MWIMLNDCFLSIVKKDCKDGELLVRARRPGDIEKVFGRKTKVDRVTAADYLFRAVIPREDVTRAMQNEVLRIDYGNFKDSVVDHDLHEAYMRVWSAMADVQDPRPYSGVDWSKMYGGARYQVTSARQTKKQRKQQRKEAKLDQTKAG